MMEWGMWPYPDEKEFGEMVKMYGGYMLAGYSMGAWAAKMDIKGMMEMGMWTMMDGSMVSMMQGMMASDQMWDQVQQGSGCLYDMMAMDEEMGAMMSDLMTRAEMEGMVGTMAATAKYIGTDENLSPEILGLMKKVHMTFDWMDMDKDFTMVFGILMKMKSRILEIPLMELYENWHKLGAETYFKVIIGEQPEVEAMLAKLMQRSSEDQFWEQMDYQVRSMVEIMDAIM